MWRHFLTLSWIVRLATNLLCLEKCQHTTDILDADDALTGIQAYIFQMESYILAKTAERKTRETNLRHVISWRREPYALNLKSWSHNFLSSSALESSCLSPFLLKCTTQYQKDCALNLVCPSLYPWWSALSLRDATLTLLGLQCWVFVRFIY